MKNIDSLIRKREAIEKKIAAAKAAEKRMAAVAGIAEKAGLLSLTDDQLEAAFLQVAQRAGIKESAAPGAGEKA
ncbi:MAG: hypothetical protein HKL99_12910 [Burkholderiales bacterium]|nr:hypothetical protein [Burkholderiales bacterium]